jgi:hypothetical protein
MAGGTLSGASSGRLAPLAAEPGLFDPTAPLDREGGFSVWGVDCSSVRVSIALDGSPPQCWTRSFTRLADPGARADAFYRETGELARAVALEAGLPDLIVVEQPTGKHPKPVLMYATGCSVAALGALGVRLEFIAVSQWKARAVGHGFAKKPQVLEWARRRGYGGSLEDEADALGIAVGGASLFGVA